MPGIEVGPALFVHFAVKAGQYHSATRQLRNDGQKICGGGKRAGGPRGQNQSLRRRGLKTGGQRPDRCGPPRRRIELLLHRQHTGPLFVQHVEKAGHAFPMFGQFGRSQILQFAKIAALIFNFIHHLGQAVGQGCGLGEG